MKSWIVRFILLFALILGTISSVAGIMVLIDWAQDTYGPWGALVAIALIVSAVGAAGFASVTGGAKS